MNSEQRIFLERCRERYATDMVQDIMPFWLKYGFDRKNGGLYTCLDRNGNLMDTTKSCVIAAKRDAWKPKFQDGPFAGNSKSRYIIMPRQVCPQKSGLKNRSQ